MININMLSLEKLCLNSVVSNFEQLYFAFTVTKDVNMEKKFEFLRRRFTQQLATALFESGKLEDNFFEFLLNEHLIYFDGAWFKNSHYLRLNSVEEIFCRTPNLKRICFNECGDEILENIAKFCPKLVEVDVTYSDVTDAGIEYLCSSENGILPCPELKNVFLMPSQVTAKGAEYLICSLPQLERFDYPNIPLLLYRIHEANLTEMQNIQCYNLVHLNVLDCCGPTSNANLLKTCLELCPKLESVDCWVSDEKDLNLFTNSCLKKVCFKFVGDINVSAINNFLKLNGCKLISLNVSNCTIHVPTLATYCPILTEFSASYINLTDGGQNQLILPSLNSCNLELLNPSPSCAKSLTLLISSSPKLECLSFANCVSSFQLRAPILSWCKTPSARKIQFICLNLKIDFLIEILSNSPSLEQMRLSRCFINSANTEEVLKDIANKLQNKPKIEFF